jgi:DTW domain-containing protein YfiP
MPQNDAEHDIAGDERADSNVSVVNFMKQVEATVQNVLHVYGPSTNIHDLPSDEREAVLIARCLRGRLDDAQRLGVCHRCWLQQPSCFCLKCPPLDEPLIWRQNAVGDTARKSSPTSILRRLFLIIHYREIFMAVDTAKLIMAVLPQSTKLVISGIPSKYQASMAELDEAVAQAKSHERRDNFLILFPDDAAETFNTIVTNQRRQPSILMDNDLRKLNDCVCESDSGNQQYDIVVIDGTWQQARRMKLRYFPPESASRNPSTPPRTVKLGCAALELIEQQQQKDHSSLSQDSKSRPSDGHQLRKHPVEWKKIATFEAVRLFLADLLQEQYSNSNDGDMVAEVGTPPWIQIKDYLRIANDAALNRKKKQTRC